MKAKALPALAAVAVIVAVLVVVLSDRRADTGIRESPAMPETREPTEHRQNVPRGNALRDLAAELEGREDVGDSGRRSFACEPSDFESSGAIFSSLEELNDFNHSVSSALSASRDAEHLLSAALFGRDGKFVMAAMREAVDLNPEDSRYQWHILQACMSEHYVGDCDVETIEAEAIRLGGRSAHVWAAIGVDRARRGDINESAEAFWNAVGAPEYRNYRIEDVLMLERSLSTVADMDYPDRMVHAFGVVDRVSSIGSDLYEACQHRDAGVG